MLQIIDSYKIDESLEIYITIVNKQFEKMKNFNILNILSKISLWRLNWGTFDIFNCPFGNPDKYSKWKKDSIWSSNFKQWQRKKKDWTHKKMLSILYLSLKDIVFLFLF